MINPMKKQFEFELIKGKIVSISHQSASIEGLERGL